MGVLCLVLVLLFSTLCPSSFAIVSVEKRELITLLCLSSWYHVAICVLWLFLMVMWVDLQCLIDVFPDPAHLPF